MTPEFDIDSTNSPNSRHLVSSHRQLEDLIVSPTRRPEVLTEFTGQKKLKEKLSIFIDAAKIRGESLDHVLFSGPPGLGKTTLAHIIAREMKVEITVTSGPVLERQGDVASLLTGLGDGDVLFIDEIHRINKVVAEVLYPAMEDYKIDIMLGKGPGARSVRLDIPPFTLIGATTRTSLIPTPMRSRFGLSLWLDFYPPEDLAMIVENTAQNLGQEIDKSSCLSIARRSRGTPRLAIRLLKRVRDYSLVRHNGKIDPSVVKAALDMMEIDDLGLDVVDRKILEAIAVVFKGGPVALDTIAITVGEDSDTIYDVYEPFLIKEGFVLRTPRGRVATARVYQHLNISRPVDDYSTGEFDFDNL